ncbi:MAG: Rpn family recombination-promoting nuclease/putative transposase [Bacteroidales bacterium]|jgi:predicted transposase/invertase (TIGR01784 family)|nr:Rpn family recombination-promoting nuclease/putative transposase [Bacteroidales bacterium]
MKRYLDPKNDLPFKRIFGEHPELLKSFLNALMPFKKNQHIVSLEYLSAEQVPNNPAKKDSIVDVKCKDNYGRQFIVEMQMYWNASFKNRLLFNTTKAYFKQLNINEDYTNLRSVYFLGIINDIFDKKKNRYYHRYVIVNLEDHDDKLEGMEFVIIELPKFKPESLVEKKMAVLWLRFLKEIEEEKYLEPAKELMENEYIRQAIDLCEEGAFTEAELSAYEKHWDIIRRENAMQSTNISLGQKKGEKIGQKKGEKIGQKKGEKIGLKKGEEIGLKKGEEIGLKKGEEIGLKKGLEEGIEKTKENIVINSFSNGFSLEIISSITALTQEEIIAILKKNKLM